MDLEVESEKAQQERRKIRSCCAFLHCEIILVPIFCLETFRKIVAA